MLKLALVFLVIGVLAGILGFTTIAGASIWLAKVLAFVFLSVFVVLVLLGARVARRIPK